MVLHVATITIIDCVLLRRSVARTENVKVLVAGASSHYAQCSVRFFIHAGQNTL